jgi:hypothetical protein
LGGGLDADDAAEVAIGVGPTRHVAAKLEDETRRTVLDAIATALSAHLDERGHVVLGAKLLITTARRSRWRPRS